MYVAPNANIGPIKAKEKDVLNEWISFFSVQYHRKTMKRHPEMRDGFLVIGKLFSILVCDESRTMAKGGGQKMSELDVGDKFALEYYRGEILEECPLKDFTSGTCFLNL